MKYRIKSIRHSSFTETEENLFRPVEIIVPPVAPTADPAVPPVSPQNANYNAPITEPDVSDELSEEDTILFAPPPPMDMQSPDDEEKPSFFRSAEGKRTIFVICGFAVLLIALIVTLVLMFGSKDNEQKPTEPSATAGCTHEFRIVINAGSEATCTKDGISYKECSLCEYRAEEITEKALGHDPKFVEEKSTPATCTEAGQNVSICQREGCGEEITEVIKPLEHDMQMDEGKSSEATCDEEGKTVEVCQREGCDYSEEETIEALGHDMQKDEEKSSEATCTEAGKTVEICQREGCEETVETPIEALGHDMKVDEEKSSEPTCTEAGKTVEICQREGCGEENPKVIEALGHLMVDGVCSVCEYSDVIKDGNSVTVGKGLQLSCGSILTIGADPKVSDSTLVFSVTMFVTDEYAESPLNNDDITVVCPGSAGELSIIVSGDFATDPTGVTSITVPNMGDGEYVITILNGRTKHTCTYTLVTEATPDDELSVTADYANAALLESNNYYHCVADDSEYMVQVAFHINLPVTDVSLSSGTLTDDGHEYTPIYHLAEMEADKPLVADLAFPGDMSSYSITFTTGDGEEHTYTIYQSGMDGSIVLN